jgi:hypothetical protein
MLPPVWSACILSAIRVIRRWVDGGPMGDIDSRYGNLSGTHCGEERAIVPPLMLRAPCHVQLKTWQAWLLALVISVPMFIQAKWCKLHHKL